MKKKKINVVTLGCSKNLVDSERLLAQLAGSGFEVVWDTDDPEARIVVVNTCGFIGDAKEESVNTILGFARARAEGRIDRLFVMGCLSERYKAELEKEIPEADRFFGVKDLSDVVRAVGADWREGSPGERVLTTPGHYAYLKISEGCNWACGYCAIPLIRGRHESVPMEQLVEEARRLADRGVKELLVIAQDTTYYGLDLYGERKLGELLRQLCRVEGIEWIRLHYAYPADFPWDVAEAMKQEPKICPYLDIPFQHVSDRMLSSMRRRTTGRETRELVARLRAEVPGIALRTTLIVGYPGETEADFRELEDFVREARFERLGVFAYSEEEGTYSARHLRDDVPQEVKEARIARIMTLQSGIARERNQALVGRVLPVMVDRREGDFDVGRTPYDSPEVDQEVLLPAEPGRPLGRIYRAEITAADHYDLYARIAE